MILISAKYCSRLLSLSLILRSTAESLLRNLKNTSAIGHGAPTVDGESTILPSPLAFVSQCTYFFTKEFRGFVGLGTKRIIAL